MAALYYNPEHFGLTLVGEVDPIDESYHFDIFAVWRGEDDILYWAFDSGCSCPAPFEDYTDLDDLTTGNKHDCALDVQAWADGFNGRADQLAVTGLIETVMSL